MGIRRGLVLEGGGAKGAYAFGCLLAFRQRGITFDAVAGTSVGALNGLLWATDSVEEERETLENLSQELIYSRKKSRLLSFIIVFFHLYASFLRGLRFNAVSRLTKITFLPLYMSGTFIVWSAFSLFLLDWILKEGYFRGLVAGPQFNAETFYAFTLFMLYLSLSLSCYLDVSFFRTYSPLAKQFTASLTCVLLLLRYALKPDLDQLVRHLPFALPGIVVLLFYAGCRRWTRAAALDSEPLRKLVRKVVCRGVKVPLYVTLAEEVEFYDPDRPVWVEGKGRRFHIHSLESERGFFPTYYAVHAAAEDKATAAVVGSTALPYGLVPEVQVGDSKYVDGGVADNCPVYPLTTIENCNEIVVVRLSPAGRPPLEVTKQLRNIDRLREVRRFQPKETLWTLSNLREWRAPYTFNDPPTTIPLQHPQSMPNKVYIYELAPSSRLGGFFSGTLRFSATYARKLIDRGYKDALVFADKIQQPATRTESGPHPDCPRSVIVADERISTAQALHRERLRRLLGLSRDRRP